MYRIATHIINATIKVGCFCHGNDFVLVGVQIIRILGVVIVLVNPDKH